MLLALLLSPGLLGALLADPTASNSKPNSSASPAVPPRASLESPPIPPLKPLDRLPASAATSGLQTISLNGNWDLTGIDPTGGKNIHIPGRVPGMVHPDLLRAGLIKDPFWRFQANDCQWVENWQWIYSRDFTLPKHFPMNSVVLRFEGLDTFATIRVNGEEIGSTDDMFIPFEFEIGSKLRPGRNHIEVAFRTVKEALGDKPYGKIMTLFDQTGERTYARKLACTFGWDWVNRFVSAGIWRPVSVTAYGAARINDVFVSTTSLGSTPGTDPATIHVNLSATLHGVKNVQAQWTLTGPADEIVWSHHQSISDGTTNMNFHIQNPLLWWPNGSGAQPLYHMRVSLADERGALLDKRTVETAIRTVRVDQKPDSIGRSFTVVINGTPIFCKGGNWVPANPFPSEVSPAKYDLLMSQAREAHMNIVRSWGGGIYESPDFFHACAQRGIMVTQDLLLACSAYPDTDPDFLNLVNREFAIAIRAERNNPALIFWTGGNELGENNRPMENWSGKNIQQGIAGPLCAQLDPTRPFFITSPHGGDPNNCASAGDRHAGAELASEIRDPAVPDYRAFVDSVTARFLSECGCGGSVPERVLLRFMNKEDISDPQMWEFHEKTNPYSGSKTTTFQILSGVAETLYGKVQPGPGMYVRHMEQAQYDFVRWSLEAARRRKPICSGILFWMYDDCWPAAGWSLVDYWGAPKAGWYAQKNGCQPAIVALEPGHDIFRWSVCNDALNPIDAKLHLTVQPWTGAPRWIKDVAVHVPANTSQVAFEIPRNEILAKAGKDSVIVADLTYPGGADRSWYYNGYPKEMAPPPVHLEVRQQQRKRDHGSITIHASTYARAVTLDANADFSDNYFEMVPGETRTITWHTVGNTPPGDIRVSCWNQSH
jgi:beta-mannosidase